MLCCIADFICTVGRVFGPTEACNCVLDWVWCYHPLSFEGSPIGPSLLSQSVSPPSNKIVITYLSHRRSCTTTTTTTTSSTTTTTSPATTSKTIEKSFHTRHTEQLSNYRNIFHTCRGNREELSK